MSNLNVVAVTGRFTAQPELKKTPNGTSVTTFTLAVDRGFTANSEKKTDFPDFVAWNKTAEFICKYFNKGDMIAVQGSIETRRFTDSKGNDRKAIEINATSVSFCGGKNNTQQAAEPLPSEYSEELPF